MDPALNRNRILWTVGSLALPVIGAIVYMATSSHHSLIRFNMLDNTSPSTPPDPDECMQAKREIENTHYMENQITSERGQVTHPNQDAKLDHEANEEARHKARMCRKYGEHSPYGSY